MFPKSSFLLIGWKKIIRLAFKWDEKKSNEFFTFGIQVQQMWYSTEGDLSCPIWFCRDLYIQCELSKELWLLLQVYKSSWVTAKFGVCFQGKMVQGYEGDKACSHWLCS